MPYSPEKEPVLSEEEQEIKEMLTKALNSKRGLEGFEGKNYQNLDVFEKKLEQLIRQGKITEEKRDFWLKLFNIKDIEEEEAA